MMGKQPTAAAIAAARAAQATWRVPASVQLAQWALESGWGTDMSGTHNPFGITAPLNGQGKPLVPATLVSTHEHIDGVDVPRHRWFRDFDSEAAAFAYHGKLLATSAYYAPAMKALPDLTGFIRLMASHYASDDGYARKLWSIINASDLTRYDHAA